MRTIISGLIIGVALPGSAAMAQPVTAVTEIADGRAVAAAVSARLAQDYVVTDMRARLVAMLDENARAGRYDGLEPQTLAERITEDMTAVAHDKHLGVRYDPRRAAMVAATPEHDDNAPDPAWDRLARRANHGIRELRMLGGNVRYMAYDSFMWTGTESATAIESAMRFLAGGDAAVIDIRQNGGGSPDAVAALASYFMAPDTDLVSFQMRGQPSGPPSRTHTTALSLVGKPLYVLASDNSASAAEEFAMHVSAFEFGTLVGSSTAGAAYRNEFVALPGGHMLSISIGRPVHAKTGGDWEGKGVAPAIAIDPANALDRAQSLAYVALGATAEGPEKSEYARLGAFYAAKANPVKPAMTLAAYAGRYGERTVSLSGDRLTIQRDGGRLSSLVTIGSDRFAYENDPTIQVRFVSTGKTVTAMEFSRAEGEAETRPRG